MTGLPRRARAQAAWSGWSLGHLGQREFSDLFDFADPRELWTY
jgi:hypothetical protein